MAERKLTDRERMRLLCEKTLELFADKPDSAEERPFFVTMSLPGREDVKGLLELGHNGQRWYLRAGAIKKGTDELTSQYLKLGTKEEVAEYLRDKSSPGELERALMETARAAVVR